MNNQRTRTVLGGGGGGGDEALAPRREVGFSSTECLYGFGTLDFLLYYNFFNSIPSK